MTESRQPGKLKTPRRWIGLAVLVGVMGASMIGCRQAPLSDTAPAIASSLADRPVNSEPTQAPALPTATPAPTATPVPTETPLQTAAATPTPLPTAVRKATLRPAAAIKRKPTATSTPVTPAEPLNFSFYWGAYCLRQGKQLVTLMITAHGGKPPYDYYNDTTLLVKSEKGSFRYELEAPAGNPVPFKIIVVDSAGQRTSQDMFYKSGLHCGES